MLERGETIVPVNVECTAETPSAAVLLLSLSLISPTAEDTRQLLVKEHVCCPRSLPLPLIYPAIHQIRMHHLHACVLPWHMASWACCVVSAYDGISHDVEDHVHNRNAPHRLSQK
jgi:hypothetical protein